jgi:hypothetical protein
MVEKVVLCAFCAGGGIFMIYVLVGTQPRIVKERANSRATPRIQDAW